MSYNTEKWRVSKTKCNPSWRKNLKINWFFLVSQSEFEWYLSCQITDFSMFFAHCASRLIVLAQFVIYFMIVVGHYRTVLWSAIQQNTSPNSIVVVSKFFFWLYTNIIIMSLLVRKQQAMLYKIVEFWYFQFRHSLHFFIGFLILLPKYGILWLIIHQYSIQDDIENISS